MAEAREGGREGAGFATRQQQQQSQDARTVSLLCVACFSRTEVLFWVFHYDMTRMAAVPISSPGRWHRWYQVCYDIPVHDVVVSLGGHDRPKSWS